MECGRQPKRGITNKEKYKRNQEDIFKSGRKTELLELTYLCSAPDGGQGSERLFPGLPQPDP